MLLNIKFSYDSSASTAEKVSTKSVTLDTITLTNIECINCQANVALFSVFTDSITLISITASTINQ